LSARYRVGDYAKGVTVTSPDWFTDEQFDIQLELEELSVAAVRERSVAMHATAAGVTHQERLNFALRVRVALLRSPLLSDEEADERFEAWCDGAAIPLDEMYREVETILRRKKVE
jgi:hypothetical protein